VGAAHHRAATTATPRRHNGAGGGEDWSRNGLGMRAPLPTTDALFAHEVEQKISNLLRIQGNGHMMMLEKNELEIAAFMAGWLQDNVEKGIKAPATR
jgi:hypothetical protein